VVEPIDVFDKMLKNTLSKLDKRFQIAKIEGEVFVVKDVISRILNEYNNAFNDELGMTPLEAYS
jgi:hypothetical protein